MLIVTDLCVGDGAILQFKLGHNVLRLRAVVRERKGARYEMEFLTLSRTSNNTLSILTGVSPRGIYRSRSLRAATRSECTVSKRLQHLFGGPR